MAGGVMAAASALGARGYLRIMAASKRYRPISDAERLRRARATRHQLPGAARSLETGEATPDPDHGRDRERTPIGN
jgi:hypothetical protein